LGLVSNDESLALDQDSLVKPAARVSQQGARNARSEAWVRELSSGSRAVGLFNRNGQSAEVTLDWDKAALSGAWTARDLWQHKDLRTFGAKLALQVPRPGAVLLKLSPAPK
jgi:alpha-galactosidase